MSGKPVVRVKNILGDDVYGLWHIKKIVVDNNGQRYGLIPNKESFSTKDDAEYYAHLKTRRFVERRLGRHNSGKVQWVRYIFIAAVASVLTAITLQCWRDRP